MQAQQSQQPQQQQQQAQLQQSIPRPLSTPVRHPILDIYRIENYTFDTKEAQHEKDKSVAMRLTRMKEKYEKDGMRRSVEAVLLVHKHGHPHVLLLCIGNNVKGFFKL